jgi:RNase H-like domain found in reverse transcriptase
MQEDELKRRHLARYKSGL